METGLGLWLALLRHATDYSEGLHNLFPRIPEMLDTDLDNLKQVQLSMTIGSATCASCGDGLVGDVALVMSLLI